MKPFHKVYSHNKKGRDFIIGDLHGCYDLLINLMDHVGFNIEIDRMFSVGDLIDRGPDSLKCLKLVKEKWFYPVKGNHEDMFLKAILQDNGWGNFLGNGGEWIREALTNTDGIEALAKFIDENVPNMITVKGETDGTGFHIIHSEFPDYEHYTDEMVIAGKHQKELMAHDQYGDSLKHMWGRGTFYDAYGADQTEELRLEFQDRLHTHYPDLSIIYAGHTIMRGSPLKAGNILNLDTGAFAAVAGNSSFLSDGFGLSMIQHDTKRVWQATSDGIKDVEIFDCTVC